MRMNRVLAFWIYPSVCESSGQTYNVRYLALDLWYVYHRFADITFFSGSSNIDCFGHFNSSLVCKIWALPALCILNFVQAVYKFEMELEMFAPPVQYLERGFKAVRSFVVMRAGLQLANKQVTPSAFFKSRFAIAVMPRFARWHWITPRALGSGEIPLVRHIVLRVLSFLWPHHFHCKRLGLVLGILFHPRACDFYSNLGQVL